MIIWPLNFSDVHVVAVESNFWLNFVRCRFYTASSVCSKSKDSLKKNIYAPIIDRKAHKSCPATPPATLESTLEPTSVASSIDSVSSNGDGKTLQEGRIDVPTSEPAPEVPASEMAFLYKSRLKKI